MRFGVCLFDIFINFIDMKYINLLFFLLMVVMNYLANSVPLGGQTTGELSARYDNLFVPAGITFSIWGVIYLLLGIFIVLQFLEQNRELVSSIGWAFAISCALNALWIVAWHYQKLPLSMLIMVALLAVLVYINFQLKTHPTGLTKAAFGIYLGWISVATIANATAWFVAQQWGGWGIPDTLWAIIMINAGLIITAAAMFLLQNPFIGIAVIWAFAGIVLNRYADATPVAASAMMATVVMMVLTIYAFVKKIS